MFGLKPHLPIPRTGKFQPRLFAGYSWLVHGLGTGGSNHLKLDKIYCTRGNQQRKYVLLCSNLFRMEKLEFLEDHNSHG